MQPPVFSLKMTISCFSSRFFQVLCSRRRAFPAETISGDNFFLSECMCASYTKNVMEGKTTVRFSNTGCARNTAMQLFCTFKLKANTCPFCSESVTPTCSSKFLAFCVNYCLDIQSYPSLRPARSAKKHPLMSTTRESHEFYCFFFHFAKPSHL